MGCNTFNYNLNHNGYPYKTISVKAFNWYFIRKELCEAEEHLIGFNFTCIQISTSTVVYVSLCGFYIAYISK